MTLSDRGGDRSAERLRVLHKATQLWWENQAEDRATLSKAPAGGVHPHPSRSSPGPHHLSWTRPLKAEGSEAMRLWASAKPSCTG